MINQIKHNPPSSVLSQFNPVASLKPQTRKRVNEGFISLILKTFFENKNGIANFSALDPDKLVTEIEFEPKESEQNKDFVKTYIYKEIIDEISKEENKRVKFKPKYVITFDSDLAGYKEDEKNYPYQQIFGKNWNAKSPETPIKYGVIRLGEAPILYYIYIDLQQLIKFIKTLPEEEVIKENDKIEISEEEKRNRLVDTVVFEKQRQMRSADDTQKAVIAREIETLEQIRQTVLEGESGKLRINLAWNTTDDLDLHVETPKGTIHYANKVVENEGVIGELDVDKNSGNDALISNPQENVNFSAMPKGEHKVLVNFFKQREQNEVSFTVTIIPEEGEGRIFTKTISGQGSTIDVVSFEYDGEELEFI